ncbi:hypothetical protein MF672_042575 [Actinomadura sp. ATCC 31491]|uniref:Calcium-binding protein n=1 Tax=Actinomadura luzonensis TaxID=2805427 RepID=A0ABT0G771_9ACTN|nr:hypothetical protein [Actinomadura luzonensis]MCK2220446.1 hypothetical protein [Actinomadura luzonensis]
MNSMSKALLAAALAAGTITTQVLPAAAQAHAAPGKAWVAGGVLIFAAGRGTSNRVVVTQQSVHIYLVDDVAQITPGAGCAWSEVPDFTKVKCTVGLLSRVVVQTRDLDDIAISEVSKRSRIYGGGGDDQLTGGSGDDWLEGEQGNDTLTGRGGADHMTGGKGGDLLQGGWGEDNLYGDGGDDDLRGGPDNDELFGGSGHDKLHGQGGDTDFADGATGNDSCFAEQQLNCE